MLVVHICYFILARNLLIACHMGGVLVLIRVPFVFLSALEVLLLCWPRMSDFSHSLIRESIQELVCLSVADTPLLAKYFARFRAG